jgi:hypothetical protein
MSVGNIEDIVGNGAGDGASAAFDPASGSLKVTEQEQPRFDDLPDPTLINISNAGAGTVNYPDDNGASHLGYKSLSFGGTITGSATDTITFQVWGYDGTQWFQVTQMFISNAGVSPPGTIQSGSATPVLFGLHIDHFPYQRWRATTVITGGTTNSATIGSYQKAI